MNQENNKLIAEFMGLDIETRWEFPNSPYQYALKYDPGFNDEHYDGELLFDKSWCWLMPVIAEIVPPHGWVAKCVKYQSEVMEYIQYANMDRTYNAVIRFIKAYNIHEKPVRHLWRAGSKPR